MKTAIIGSDLRLIIIKLLLYFILKGCFSVLKDFDQELETMAEKSLQFYMLPT